MPINSLAAMFDWLLRAPEPFEIVDLRWDQVDFASAPYASPRLN